MLLAAVAAVGIALMLMGGGSSEGEKATPSDPKQQLLEYSELLRGDIQRLCQQVGGVSDVTVAVSLERGFEYVYATDLTLEQGGGGADSRLEYVTVGNGSSEEAVYITQRLPSIGGVGIVCRGGSDPEVVRRLTALISAAYNIGANKIYVTGT